jgi:protein TonB
MFEGSLVESRGLLVSKTARWTALGSATVQFAIAGLLVAIPMLHPDILPLLKVDAPKLVVPVPKAPPPPVRAQTEAADSTSEAISAPAPSPAPVSQTQSLLLSLLPNSDPGPGPAIAPNFNMNGSGTPGVLSLGIPGPGNVAVARATKSEPFTVSKGVSEGMLLAPIQPVYPQIARVTRTEGTVVMEAVISKAGRIESLRAVSGPEMLRRAALDAVSAARYRPYLLNGEPTEVQTTITVNFRLGS